MIRAPLLAAALLMPASAPAQTSEAQPPARTASAQGVFKLQSANDFDTTIAKIKADVAAKGVMWFGAVDQQALAKSAGITLRRSTLVEFGNPPLGIQFLTANPIAGLAWPVRMLVAEDADGSVWIAWNDFAYTAKRYGITNRDPQFKMAAEVSGSVAKAGASK